MNSRFESVIVKTAIRYAIPFIMVYGVYVLTHGEISPGGGFQAGALFAIAVVLSRLVQGDQAQINISGKKALIVAGLGTFFYAFVGWVTIFNGGNFLEYSFLPFNMHEAERHAMGILGIEIGVTIGVMATIIVIYDALTGGGDNNDH